MIKLELGVLPSEHLQLFSTEDNDSDQKTGQAVIADAFAQDIAKGLITLAAKDNAANLSLSATRSSMPRYIYRCSLTR